jgi:hypothetical protein
MRKITTEESLVRATSAGLSGRELELIAGGNYSFSGKPCPRGHLAPRSRINHSCRACAAEREKLRSPEQARIRCRKASWKRNGMPEPTRPRPSLCELCGGPPTARALHLDHDKITGAFRGWLCHYCNTNLGRFGDSEAGLRRALDYLERAKS